MTEPSIILKNIRQNLGRANTLMPEPRPAILEPRQPGNMSEELSRLFSEITQLSGRAEQINRSDLFEYLRKLVADNNIAKATAWQTEGLFELKIEAILSELGVEIISPYAEKHILSQCDLGITEVDFALPETGTLVLRSNQQKPRLISLLPRVHLAILNPSVLRPDLHQVFLETKTDPYLVFITGPSRTADIELTVSLGVHGPKALIVLSLL